MTTTSKNPSVETAPASSLATPAARPGTPRRAGAAASKPASGRPRTKQRSQPRRADLANLVFGRKLHSDQEIHERLDNPTALAVFASDALSSVAYATEEMLRIMLPVAAAAAFSAVLPLSIGIVLLLVALVFSYRQTIKAYPTAGGAYIVTRDNFGILPAQVAGVALLTDYILTVAVSVSAGIAALYSAFPGVYPYRVPVAVATIWVIAIMNLRGVKDSGRVFAFPTYLFVASVLGLVVVGIVRALAGGLSPVASSHSVSAAGIGGGLSVFLLLHAFAGGSTAMTGVEAISNGVPAFKPVEWKNARRVLAWLGVLLGAMFLGLSFLAWKLQPVPTEQKTVISQIADAILGRGWLGSALFLVVQTATMLILVLAANTSFADFPRLASFHAHDHFLPTPLTRRGRRLVFSNGIVALAALATVLVIAFGADVHHLIPLYAIGVFTSFTLSQAGMAKRHLTIREPGWKRGTWVNGIGAVASGVVGVVIAVTKFTHGAWIIMLVVPLTVAVLVRVNRHYEEVAQRLDVSDPDLPILRSRIRMQALVLVSRCDEGLDRAMRYVREIDPDGVRAVHIGGADASLGAAFWARYGRELEIVPSTRVFGLVSTARALVRAERAARPDAVLAVVVPETIEESRWWHILRHNDALRLKAGLLFEPGAVVVNVPTVPADEALRSRPARRHVVVVPVDTLHASARETLRLANRLGAHHVRGVHVAEEAADAEALQDRWVELGIPAPLDIVASPYRELGASVLEEVRAIKGEGADLVTVVVNELVPRWWHHGLHNHRALQMKVALLFEPGVAVISVPHHLSSRPGARADR